MMYSMMKSRYRAENFSLFCNIFVVFIAIIGALSGFYAKNGPNIVCIIINILNASLNFLFFKKNFTHKFFSHKPYTMYSRKLHYKKHLDESMKSEYKYISFKNLKKIIKNDFSSNKIARGAYTEITDFAIETTRGNILSGEDGKLTLNNVNLVFSSRSSFEKYFAFCDKYFYNGSFRNILQRI